MCVGDLCVVVGVDVHAPQFMFNDYRENKLQRETERQRSNSFLRISREMVV